MARLTWTPHATHDFESICDYLRKTTDSYIRRFAVGIHAIARDAADNPYFGAEVEKYARDDIRERLFDSYRVIYLVCPDEIRIITVIHASRQLPRTLPE